MVKTIELVDGVVKMLDQTKLPREVIYNDCKDYLMVAKGIKDLWIRGAPAIGIASSMGIAIGANAINADNYDDFMKGLEPVWVGRCSRSRKGPEIQPRSCDERVSIRVAWRGSS